MRALAFPSGGWDGCAYLLVPPVRFIRQEIAENGQSSNFRFGRSRGGIVAGRREVQVPSRNGFTDVLANVDGFSQRLDI